MEKLYILSPWHWWALASLLLLAELLAPGAWYLALSVSALATGMVGWMRPDLGGLVQLGIFIALSAITLPGFQFLLRRRRSRRTTRQGDD